MFFPIGCSLVVALQPFVGRTLEHGGVEMRGVKTQHVHQEFPCPVDGLFLEIVAERPVAEHLEHGVVVGVETDLLQIVVLAAHAQTLL